MKALGIYTIGVGVLGILLIKEPPRILDKQDEEGDEKLGFCKTVKKLLITYLKSLKILISNKNTLILFLATFFHWITSTTIGNQTMQYFVMHKL